MGKVTLGQWTDKNEEFVGKIKGKVEELKKNGRKLSIASGMGGNTYYSRMNDIEKMTVKELRVYVKELEIDEWDLLNFIYRKNYITERTLKKLE